MSIVNIDVNVVSADIDNSFQLINFLWPWIEQAKTICVYCLASYTFDPFESKTLQFDWLWQNKVGVDKKPALSRTICERLILA